jgi:hypothetical protein
MKREDSARGQVVAYRDPSASEVFVVLEKALATLDDNTRKVRLIALAALACAVFGLMLGLVGLLLAV